MDYIPCPLCGADVPKYRGYSSWCACGWNVEPELSSRRQRKLFDIGYRLYQAMHTGDGQRSVRTREKFNVALGIWITVIVSICCALSAYLSVTLFRMPGPIAKGIGVLFAVLTLSCIVPLFGWNATRKHTKVILLPKTENTQLTDALRVGRNTKGMPRICKIRLLEHRWGMRIVKPVFALKSTLEIGTHFLNVLNHETFEAGLLRESMIQKDRLHRVYDWIQWADSILVASYEILASQSTQMKNADSSDPSISQRTRRTTAGGMVYFAQVFVKPIAVFPLALHTLLERHLMVLDHIIVYRANSHAVEYASREAVQGYLIALSLREPTELVLSRLQLPSNKEDTYAAVQEKMKLLPEREIQRLVRSTVDDWHRSLMIHWQTQVLKLTDSAGSKPQQISVDQWDSIRKQLSNQ